MKKILLSITLIFILVGLAWAGKITSRTRYGMMEFYDKATGETVDVMAHQKLFPNWVTDNVSGSYYAGVTTTYIVTTVNSGTAALDIGNTTSSAGTPGNLGALVRTGVADNDNTEIASALNFTFGQNATAEARFAIGSADDMAFNFGITDAQTEGADALPVLRGAGGTWPNLDDGAIIFYDPDGTTDVVYAASYLNDVSSTEITSTVPVAGTYYVARVELNADGRAEFFWNGSYIGKSNKVHTTTNDQLCAYFGIQRRTATGGPAYATLTYLRAWSKR